MKESSKRPKAGFSIDFLFNNMILLFNGKGNRLSLRSQESHNPLESRDLSRAQTPNLVHK